MCKYPTTKKNVITCVTSIVKWRSSNELPRTNEALDFNPSLIESSLNDPFLKFIQAKKDIMLHTIFLNPVF